MRAGSGGLGRVQPGPGRLTLALVAATSVACGKSGPPLPPLVRIPAPPTELVAARRGDAVDIRFLVPSANTDGSRPANLRSVEVYAYTGPANLTDEQVVKLGSRVGSVDVKAPRDPNATVDPDEPVSDVPAPEGQGLEQGVAASVREVIGPSASTAVHLPGAPGQTPRETPPLPLAGPPETPVTRVYAGVGITTSGRRGPFSRRAPVPLAPPPPAVPAPDVSYDESAVRVAWEAAPAPAILEEAEGETLPARLIGSSQSSVSYNVYERRPSTSDSAEPVETRLTTAPITETRFEDSRVEWGVERCYGVAVTRTFGGMTIESRLSPVTCRQLVDTFPPKAPAGLQTIPSEGLISLVWDQNRETDLAGYLVLRGEAPSGVLAPMTPSPIQQASFTDKAPSGVRFVYAVQAVDRAGNVSAESARTEETAR